MNPNAHLGLLWRRFTVRHWRETPGQSFLLVLILALGIAVYFSVRLANRAATSSFRHFTDLVTAESDWLIQAPSGDLPESVLVELRTRLDGAPVHLVPIVESTGTSPPNGEPETIGSRPTFRLLGVDLIGIQNVARDEAERSPDWFGPGSTPRSSSSAASSSSDALRRTSPPVPSPPPPDDGESSFWGVLRDPTSVFVSDTLARRSGLNRGSRLPLILNEHIVPLTVAGVIPDLPGQPSAPAELLVMDLPALQRWTGRTGLLTRVELRIEPGPHADQRRHELRNRLEAWGRLPGSAAPTAPGLGDAAESQRWLVRSPSERREAGPP